MATPAPDWMERVREQLKERCAGNRAANPAAVSAPPPAPEPPSREYRFPEPRRPRPRALPGERPVVLCDECGGPDGCFGEMPSIDPTNRPDPLVVKVPPIPIVRRCPRCEFKNWEQQGIFPPR